MARDPDIIQREIEQARDALASTLDRLSNQASPKRLVDNAKVSAMSTLDQPRIKYPLMIMGLLVMLLFLRKLFR